MRMKQRNETHTHTLIKCTNSFEALADEFQGSNPRGWGVCVCLGVVCVCVVDWPR